MLSSVSRAILRRSLNSRQPVPARCLSTSATDRLLVIGSGVAGCSAALIAAERHQIPVTVLCAGVKTDCNSYWAQGGIIYRNYHPEAGDSAASLAADIHRAGAGLCVEDAVQKVAKEGPDRVKELLLSEEGIFANVPFQKDENGEWALCLGAYYALFHFPVMHAASILNQHPRPSINRSLTRGSPHFVLCRPHG
jgi:L-aspartate oxidase